MIEMIAETTQQFTIHRSVCLPLELKKKFDKTIFYTEFKTHCWLRFFTIKCPIEGVILDVFFNPNDASNLILDSESYIDSMGLYGISKCSSPSDTGFDFSFDITRFFTKWFNEKKLNTGINGFLNICISPRPQIIAMYPVTINRVDILLERVS